MLLSKATLLLFLYSLLQLLPRLIRKEQICCLNEVLLDFRHLRPKHSFASRTQRSSLPLLSIFQILFSLLTTFIFKLSITANEGRGNTQCHPNEFFLYCRHSRPIKHSCAFRTQRLSQPQVNVLRHRNNLYKYVSFEWCFRLHQGLSLSDLFSKLISSYNPETITKPLI